MLATDFLEQVHRDIEELLREVDTAEEKDVLEQKRKDLADTIMAHFSTVESVFYKIAIQFAGENAIPRALEEQGAIAYMLWRFMQAPLDRTVFAARLDVLKDLLMNHIEEQEMELFVALKSEMPRSDHYDLSAKLQRSYEEFLRIGYVRLLANHFALHNMPKSAPTNKKKKVKPLRFVQITSNGGQLAGLTKVGRVYQQCPHTYRWIATTMMPIKAKKRK